jgi:hypothetical protein
VPAGSHAEEESQAEGLAGNDGGGVGDEARFNELLALVDLGGERGGEANKERNKKEKGPAVIDRRYKMQEGFTHFAGRR